MAHCGLEVGDVSNSLSSLQVSQFPVDIHPSLSSPAALLWPHACQFFLSGLEQNLSSGEPSLADQLAAPSPPTAQLPHLRPRESCSPVHPLSSSSSLLIFSIILPVFIQGA